MTHFTILLSNEQKKKAYEYARIQIALRGDLYICKALKRWIVIQGYVGDATITSYTIRTTFPEFAKQKPFFKRWSKPWWPVDIVHRHKRLDILTSCLYKLNNPSC